MKMLLCKLKPIRIKLKNLNVTLIDAKRLCYFFELFQTANGLKRIKFIGRKFIILFISFSFQFFASNLGHDPEFIDIASRI